MIERNGNTVRRSVKKQDARVFETNHREFGDYLLGKCSYKQTGVCIFKCDICVDIDCFLCYNGRTETEYTFLVSKEVMEEFKIATSSIGENIVPGGTFPFDEDEWISLKKVIKLWYLLKQNTNNIS